MIKLVIFDLDGVLVDACEWHRIALNQALKEMCNYEIPIEDHYSLFNGIPTRTKLKKLSEMGLVPWDQHMVINNRKQELTIKIINDNAFFRKEKVEMMNFLHSKGVYVACYTNSIRKTATLMLEKTGVYEHLDLILTNEDVENNKPHPDGYLFILKHFNVKQNNAIIVEDSPKGITAAKSAGCKVVEVKNAKDVNKTLFEGLII